MTTHYLKTDREAFIQVGKGFKKAEFRKDDREERYDVGDTLVLVEVVTEPSGGIDQPHRVTPTGRDFTVQVTHILRGPDYGIPTGYCMMSITQPNLGPNTIRLDN